MSAIFFANLAVSDTRLEDLRASVKGVDSTTLAEKMQAHKANSFRGRKPKSKKGDDSFDEGGPMDDVAFSESLPVAVSRFPALPADPNQYSF